MTQILPIKFQEHLQVGNAFPTTFIITNHQPPTFTRRKFQILVVLNLAQDANRGEFLDRFSRKNFIWVKSLGHNERCAAARKPLCVTCTMQIISGKMDLSLSALLFPTTPITGGPFINFGVGGGRKVCSLNYTTSSSLFILESCPSEEEIQGLK